LFGTFKSYREPDPDLHGSAFVWLPLIWIRIRIEIKTGSGSALKPMRVHNTGFSSTVFSKGRRGLERPGVAFVVRGRFITCARSLRHMREVAALSTRLSHHARLRCIMHMTVAYTMPSDHARCRWVMRDAAESCTRSQNHV
jgi:hypothetical protein